MLNNFLITCNIMLPLVFYMLIGLAGRSRGIFGDSFKKSASVFLNKILLPFTAFNSLYKADLSGLSSGSSAVRYVGIATISALFLMMLAAKKIEPDTRRRASLVHCAVRGNTMLYALPVAAALYGADNVGDLMLVMAVVITIYNVAFVLMLEYYRSVSSLQKGEFRKHAGRIIREALKSCARNGILQGIALGFAANLFGIKLPAFLLTGVSNVAGMTVPMSFLLMGVRLDLQALRSNRRDVIIATAVKLVLLPALAVIYPLLKGWNGRMFAAIFLCFSTSTAVSAFPMSEAMGADGELAGEIVMVSAVFSVFTLFLWIFGFKQAGII